MLVKKAHLSLVVAMLLAQPVLAEGEQPGIGPFKTSNEAISYTVGASVGRNFKKDDVAIDEKLFAQGLADGLAGNQLKLTEEEFKSVLAGFQGDMRRKLAANQQERAIKNQERADKFLAENAKQEGVVSLPSGVQYKILKAGNGKMPLDSDVVEVNYRGTLLDGKQFDATQPGKPANLKLAQVIAGWKEALKLMPVGSKWQLFIPSKHAYGPRGVGTDIGPNEMLIFEVELLSIK